MLEKHFAVAWAAMMFLFIATALDLTRFKYGADFPLVSTYSIVGFLLVLMLIYGSDRKTKGGVFLVHRAIFLASIIAFSVSIILVYWIPIVSMVYTLPVMAFSGVYLLWYYRFVNDALDFDNPRPQGLGAKERVIFFLAGQLYLVVVLFMVMYANVGNPNFPIWIFFAIIVFSIMISAVSVFRYMHRPKV